jgi:hypothetical protein
VAPLCGTAWCSAAHLAQPSGRAVEAHKPPRRSIPANARPREVAQRAVARRWSPESRRDEAVRTLLARGVPLTAGQRVDLLVLLCSGSAR